MNFSPSECLLGRQRCRQWLPLITQQIRLRHLYQIIGYNFYTKSTGNYYYTLHLTSMSAPFYTSEKLEGPTPKWMEIDIRDLVNTSISALVLRVWQEISGESDIIILTLGINFSSLVYLGNKISDILTAHFEEKTIILLMRGGYFTLKQNIKQNLEKPLPFNDNLNIKNGKIYKKTSMSFNHNEVRTSYSIDKLRKLHSLEISIKNNVEDLQRIRENILSKTDVNQTSSQSLTNNLSSQNVRYEPQMLTMNSLNKLLQVKPTKLQRQEMVKTKKEIEWLKFKNRLLSQEKDTKTILVKHLKQTFSNLIDKNEEKNSEIMENYHKLKKEKDNLRDFQKNILKHKDIYCNTNSQLQHRRRQLLKELLFIYPIRKISDNKYTIHNVYLPNSDVLADCSDPGLSVSLGYVTHVLIMCSMFLQVPLRYPLTHYGSRSSITDHIKEEKDFPLFTKGKDRNHFPYAVYLLNKNIAQLRWTSNQQATIDLKATLSNLLMFLDGKDSRSIIHYVCSLDTRSDLLEDYSSTTCLHHYIEQPLHLNFFDLSTNNNNDPLLDSIRYETNQKSIDLNNSSIASASGKIQKNCVLKKTDNGPGLSEILAIPEAFLNKQISSDSFKNYVISGRNKSNSDNSINRKLPYWDIAIKNENQSDASCDIVNEIDNLDISIEQGKDTLDPSFEFETKPINIKNNLTEQNKFDWISKSENLNLDDCVDIHKRFKTTNLTGSLKEEDLSSLYFKERKTSTSSSSDKFHENPLTVRTDALRATKTFNLVRPKH